MTLPIKKESILKCILKETRVFIFKNSSGQIEEGKMLLRENE